MNEVKELVAFGKVFLPWAEQLKALYSRFHAAFLQLQGLEIPTYFQ